MPVPDVLNHLSVIAETMLEYCGVTTYHLMGFIALTPLCSHKVPI